MSSFVDLYSNIEWTDKDITSRTEAMVAAVVSPEDERILNRKLQAMQLGEYTLDQDDIMQINALKEIANAAHAMGISARSDMELLKKAWVVEIANNVLFRANDYIAVQNRIGAIEAQGSLTEMEIYELNNLRNVTSPTENEITDAHAVINSAAPEVLSLVQLRTNAGISYVPNISKVPNVNVSDPNVVEVI